MGRVSVWVVHGDELDESGEMSAAPGEGLSVDIHTIAAEASWECVSVALSSSGVENHNRRLQDCEMVSGCTFTEELHCGFHSLKG